MFYILHGEDAFRRGEELAKLVDKMGDPGMTDLTPGAEGSIELAVEGASKGRRVGERESGVDRYAPAGASSLEQRGATGVGAVLPSGPSPVGHKSRTVGLFFPETIDNVRVRLRLTATAV